MKWIIRFGFQRFFFRNKTFGDLSSTSSVIHAVAKMTLTDDSTSVLAKRFMEEGLKDSQKLDFKMVLLLDGYNEISEFEQQHTLKLVNTLTTCCNIEQILITTQTQLKASLEIEFGVPAYFLNTLDSQEQENLMVRYWKSRYSSESPPVPFSEKQLCADARNALRQWKESISDKEVKSFTEVSLNLIMLADVLLKDRHIHDNIDLADLYKKFVQKKISIYSKQTKPYGRARELAVDVVKEKIFEVTIVEVLQQLSVEDMSNKYKKFNTLPSLMSNENFNKSCEEASTDPKKILAKIGILTLKQGTLDFSHCSFAQFFFSGYLFTNLNVSTLKEFFVCNFLVHSDLQLCRKSLDRLMGDYYKKKQSSIKIKLTIKDKQSLLRKKGGAFVIIQEGLVFITLLLLESLEGSAYIAFLGKILTKDNPQIVDWKILVEEFCSNCNKLEVAMKLVRTLKIDKYSHISRFIKTKYL